MKFNIEIFWNIMQIVGLFTTSLIILITLYFLRTRLLEVLKEYLKKFRGKKND
jgi:hypothetical protein